MKKRAFAALFLMAALLLGLCACSGGAEETAAPQDPIVVACIGDSITFGAGVTSASDTYPGRLQKLLGDEYSVKNYGASGRTLIRDGRDNEDDDIDMSYWVSGEMNSSINCEPDICVIMLGTNDAKPFNWDPDTYKETYIELINMYRELPSAPRIILMISPAAFEPTEEGKGISGISETVKNELPPIVRAVAEETGCELIDLYALTEGQPELFTDGVHPNKDGNKVIAQAVYDQITK